jgi:preprotein translocase subunit SecG
MVIILVIHLLIAIALVGAILLQKKEGGLGGLGGGGSGGMGGMMSGRAKSDLLSRTTGILAAAFFVTSLTLAVVGARTTQQGPLVPATSSGTVVPAAPAGGDVGGEAPTEAPAESAPESTPAAPATPTVPAGQ